MTIESQSASAVEEAWRSVFGRDLGPDEDFFLVGGTSLQAAEVCALLSEAVGTRVRLRTLLDNPTIRELAAALHQGQ